MSKKIYIFKIQILIILCIIIYYFYSIFIIFENKNIVKKKNNKKVKKYKKIKTKLFQYKLFMKELPIYNHTHYKSNKIFWCWLQGTEKSPKLIRACLNSVKRNCKNHEIIIIRNENINKFVHIPPYILKKFQKNYIGFAHFADLLRLELLLKYGGTWIDSTVLITKYNHIFFKNDLFFFQQHKYPWYAGSNWFISAEKESPILRTTLDMLYEFWARNNKIWHYFLFHLFLKMACKKYMKDYKNIPLYSNRPPHLLKRILFKPFNILKYNHILKYTTVHKLTRKRTTNKIKGLVYHHILDKFLF